jgi:AraC-like DNA-binding protein
MLIESLYGERYVLADGSIARLSEIKLGIAGTGMRYRTVGNIIDALCDSGVRKAAALIVMSVSEGTVEAVARCTRVADDGASEHVPVIVVGPTRAPGLRVQCFRAGVVDYIDAGAGSGEVEMRVRARLEGGQDACGAAAAVDDPLANERVSRKHEIYRLAVRYLSNCEITDISRQLLATRMGVSVASLEAAFRDVAGCSVVRFIKQQRIERARALLSNSSLSVTAIAEMLGFSGGANFATMFRQSIGETPSGYREARMEAIEA